MKKLLLVALGIALTSGIYAQSFALGLRAGVNNGNLSTKLPGISEGTLKNGLTVGAFGRLGILGFFVQPEVNYSNRVGEFVKVGSGTFTNTISTIDINAMIGYSLLGIIRVNVGPTMMMVVKTAQDAAAILKDPNFGSDYYNNAAYGFQAGFGFDLGNLCFDLRYDHSLTSLGKSSVNSSFFGSAADYSTGFSMFQATLGLKLIKL